ncbi:hypothetical protein KKF34_02520 [Myxococcota bacterium]|nr:hypothetical protein [Myxococcota bacterium]MBU1495737.1 hypothetical protein [Myxococcota bacterium]
MKTNGIQNNKEMPPKPKKYSLSMFQKDNFSTILNDVEVFFEKKESVDITPPKTKPMEETPPKTKLVGDVKKELIDSPETTDDSKKGTKSTTGEKFLLLNYIMEEENLDRAVTDLRHIRFGGDESTSFKQSVEKKSAALTLSEDDIKKYTENDKRKEKIKKIFPESVFPKSSGEKPMFRGEVQSKAFPQLDNFVNVGKKPDKVMVDEQGVSFSISESYGEDESDVYFVDVKNDLLKDKKSSEKYNQVDLPLSNSGEFPVFLTVLPSNDGRKEKSGSIAGSDIALEPGTEKEELNETKEISSINSGNEKTNRNKEQKDFLNKINTSTGSVSKQYKTGQFIEIEDEVDSILTESLNDNTGKIEKRRIVFATETGEFNSLLLEDDPMFENYMVSQEEVGKTTDSKNEDGEIDADFVEPVKYQMNETHDREYLNNNEIEVSVSSVDSGKEFLRDLDSHAKVMKSVDYPEEMEIISGADESVPAKVEPKVEVVGEGDELNQSSSGLEVVVDELSQKSNPVEKSFVKETKASLDELQSNFDEIGFNETDFPDETGVSHGPEESVPAKVEPKVEVVGEGDELNQSSSGLEVVGDELSQKSNPVEKSFIKDTEASLDELQVKFDGSGIKGMEYSEGSEVVSGPDEIISAKVVRDKSVSEQKPEENTYVTDMTETVFDEILVNSKIESKEYPLEFDVASEVEEFNSAAVDDEVVSEVEEFNPAAVDDEVLNEVEEFNPAAVDNEVVSEVEEFNPAAVDNEVVNEVDKSNTAAVQTNVVNEDAAVAVEDEIIGKVESSQGSEYARVQESPEVPKEGKSSSLYNPEVNDDSVVNFQDTDVSTEKEKAETQVRLDSIPDVTQKSNPMSEAQNYAVAASEELPATVQKDFFGLKTAVSNPTMAGSDEHIENLSFETSGKRNDYIDEMLIQDFDDGVRTPIETDIKANTRAIKGSEVAVDNRNTPDANQKTETKTTIMAETENKKNNDFKTADNTTIERVETLDMEKEIEIEAKFSSTQGEKSTGKTFGSYDDRSAPVRNPELQTKNVKIPVSEKEILTPSYESFSSGLTDIDVLDNPERLNNVENNTIKPENTTTYQKGKSKIDKDIVTVVNNEKVEFKFAPEIKEAQPPLAPEKTDAPEKVIEKIMEKAVSAEDGKEIRVTYKGTEIRVREENDGIRIYIDGKDTNLIEQIKNDALNIEKMLKNQGHNLLSFEFGSSSERHHRTSTSDDETYEIDITDSNNSKNTEAESNRKATGTKSAKNNLLDFMA